MTKIIDNHGIYLIAEPAVDWDELQRYFSETGFSPEWLDRVAPEHATGVVQVDLDDWRARSNVGVARRPVLSDIETVSEFAGRRCYRSFGVGDNPNVSQVRKDSQAWFDNVKEVRHGSVLEHGMFTFVFEGVSRVFTHELVRHRVGVGISQESMRFVRLQDIAMWFPAWAQDDEDLMRRNLGVLEVLENHQRWMAEHFGLERPCVACGGSGWEGGSKDPFARRRPSDDDEGACTTCQGEGTEQVKADFPLKKFYTSFMRRFAPEGVATGIVWSGNIRIVRWVLQQRTESGAEEEIRLVFSQVADRIVERFPLAFGDFHRNEDGEWVTDFRKV